MNNKGIKLLKENEEGFGVIVEWNTSNGSTGSISEIMEGDNLLKEFAGDKGSKDSIFIKCVLQKHDVENRNGRFYPKAILTREDTAYQTLIKEGRALGEANHPESPHIDTKNSCHRVVKTWWDGNTLMGVLEILTSRAYHESGIICCSGDIVADLLRRGVKLGISSRGLGSLKNMGGKNVVQSDFQLVCYDIVTSPSTPGAFLYPDDETTPLKEQDDKVNNTIVENDFMRNMDLFLS